jgi:hypothetical protein
MGEMEVPEQFPEMLQIASCAVLVGASQYSLVGFHVSNNAHRNPVCCELFKKLCVGWDICQVVNDDI